MDFVKKCEKAKAIYRKMDRLFETEMKKLEIAPREKNSIKICVAEYLKDTFPSLENEVEEFPKK